MVDPDEPISPSRASPPALNLWILCVFTKMINTLFHLLWKRMRGIIIVTYEVSTAIIEIKTVENAIF